MPPTQKSLDESSSLLKTKSASAGRLAALAGIGQVGVVGDVGVDDGPGGKAEGPCRRTGNCVRFGCLAAQSITYLYSDGLQHQVYAVQAVADQLESVRLSKLSAHNAHDYGIITLTIRSYSNLNESTSKVKDAEKGKHI